MPHILSYLFKRYRSRKEKQKTISEKNYKLTHFAYPELYEKAITRVQYPRNKATAFLGIPTKNYFKSTNELLVIEYACYLTKV